MRTYNGPTPNCYATATVLPSAQALRVLPGAVRIGWGR